MSSLIYLDYGATVWPKPDCVVRAMREALEAGSPQPGDQPVAAHTYKLLAETRAELAAFLGTDQPNRIVFTGNATDALNMAIKGAVQAEDHVVLSALEHNAAVRPLRGLENRARVALDVVPFDAEGHYEPEELAARVVPGRTRLVVGTLVSNVLGTIQRVEALVEAVRSVSEEILVLVDAAQGAGIVPIDVQALDVDLLAVTGHKNLYGPQGIGALYVGPRAEKVLTPWREGGTGDGGELHPDLLPQRMEGGTPNVPGIAGLRAGLGHLASLGGPQGLLEHERSLSAQLREGLATCPGIQIFGPVVPEAGVVTFTLEGFSPAEVSEALLTEYGIASRAGVHCAPLVHKQLGTWPEGAVRFSVGGGTTVEEIRAAIDAVRALSSSSGI